MRIRSAFAAFLLAALAIRAGAACPGDCDGNQSVSGVEIDAGVEILLGRQALATCPAADADAGGTVTARDLVRAVTSLVQGCAPDSAIVAGRVSDVDGGSALFGVTVRLGLRTASTDSNGIFQFSDVSAGPAILAFSRDGYAPTAETLQAGPGSAPAAVFMKAVTGKFTFAGPAGGTFQAGGSVLRIEAASLQDGSGNPVTGEVEVQITKFNAGTSDINAFPGPFEGTTAGGQPADIESFGFATYALTAGGQPVNLVPGSTAEIEFLIADSDQGKFTAGQQVGLWGYNQASGQWIEQPVPGTIQPSSQQAGKLAWVAGVPHFSTWNCDRPVTEKHCLRGTVTTNGSPASGAHVSAAGVTYNGVSEATTGTDGTFCVDVKRGETVRVEVRINGAPTILASRQVVVPDVEASCATGGCTVLEAPLSVSFDACVSGMVRDAQGQPAAGVTAYVIPGETVTTGPDGRYCAAAPSGASITIIAAGYLSATTTTAGSATCDTGCATADLATLLPGEGFTIASASVSYGRTISPPHFPGAPTTSTEQMNAGGNFLVISFGANPGSNTTTTFEEVGGCDVVTTVTIYDPENPPLSPPFTVLPLDPGNPGEVSNGTLTEDLLRGDPASVDPPSPYLLGTFELAPETDMLALGFQPGQTYSFSWPGGSDIGAFSGSVGLSPAIVVSMPVLMDPALELTAGVPYSTTWTPSGNPGDEMVISLTTSANVVDQQTGFFTSTSVTVWCTFPDSPGSATIPADATSRLLSVHDTGSVGYVRSRETLLQAPLLRTGGTTTVGLRAQASLQRAFFAGFGG